MKPNNYILKMLVTVSIVFFSISCRTEGPAERAGREADEAIEKMRDTVNDTTDSIQRTTKDLVNELNMPTATPSPVAIP